MKCFLILIFVLILSENFYGADNKWELLKKEERYSIFSRNIPGTDLVELKSTAYFTGTVKEAVEILKEFEKHHTFMPYVEKVTVLKKKGNCYYTYTILDPPIVSKRDYLLKQCFTKITEKEAILEWNSYEDKNYSSRNDFVRVVRNKGSFTFKQVKQYDVEVTYYVHTDPGGSIPGFIKRRIYKSGMLEPVWAVYHEIMRRRKIKK